MMVADIGYFDSGIRNSEANSDTDRRQWMNYQTMMAVREPKVQGHVQRSQVAVQVR